MTLEEAVRLYLAARADDYETAPRTLKSLRVSLGISISLLGPQTRLDELTPARMRTLLHSTSEGLPSVGLSANTRVARHGHLRVWLRWCTEAGLPMPAQWPLAGVAKPKSAPRHNYAYLDQDQLWAVINTAANPRDRALLVLGAFTAMRISELLTAKIKDLDLAKGTLTIVRPKTRTRDEIPLPPVLCLELSNWLEYYRGNIGGELDGEMILVPRTKPPKLGGYVYDRYQERVLLPYMRLTDASTIIQNALTAAGVGLYKEGWHTLRRSAARIVFNSFSQQENGGGDRALLKTMAFLGHKQAETTIRYIGLDPTRHEMSEQIKAGAVFAAPALRVLEEVVDENSEPVGFPDRFGVA